MSRAIMDMRAEGELNKFLDEHFYSELLGGIKCKDIERITDKETQKKGVDVVISNVKNDKYYIDEKAQLYYINESLPTFAFEIDYINRYKEVAEGK